MVNNQHPFGKVLAEMKTVNSEGFVDKIKQVKGKAGFPSKDSLKKVEEFKKKISDATKSAVNAANSYGTKSTVYHGWIFSIKELEKEMEDHKKSSGIS